MHYRRALIEVESPEERGYATIDANLAESSVADASLADLGIDTDVSDLLLSYGDHRGHRRLRELIAATGEGVVADDVVVTPGAAAALFCVNTAVLARGDHAVIASPNYTTNLETPRAAGAEVSTVEVRFDDRWALDLDRLAALVRPGVTKLVSLTYPHNPTGAMITEADLRGVVELTERAGAVLLFDETYRDLTVGNPLPVAASLSPRVVSVSSLSKAYGLPGLRVGWAVCRDPALAETLLAAKEQIFICGPAIDEELAARILARRQCLLPPIQQAVAQHLDATRRWVDSDSAFEWVEPNVGLVSFPRLACDVDPVRFHAELEARRTVVGPGRWFGCPDRYFRVGFGWPGTAELERGLGHLSGAALAAAR